MAFQKVIPQKVLSVGFLLALYFFLSPPLVAQNTGTYTCPMHPEIHAAKPGQCPVCGMDLIKEKPKKAKAKQANPKPKPAQEDPGAIPMTKDPNKAKPMDQMQRNEEAGKIQEQDHLPRPDKKSSPPLKAGQSAPPRTVRYDLYIGDTLVHYTGKKRRALCANGRIPMPTLTFTEGDTAAIYVHNRLKETTSLHWHGIILPNRFDGVPYLTTAPIRPGETHLFTFPVVQNGTYWYHSHTRLQEQRGMYGALIFEKRREDKTRRASDEIPDLALVLSEWTDEKPYEIHRSLHNATDWYSIRKGSTQNYGQALRKGYFKTKLTNEWKRMSPMDVSDVYYDRFLINGQATLRETGFKKGDQVRLRVINGGASSYFWLQFAGGKMTVVGNDGEDVEPVEVDRLLIAVAETYDIVLTLPGNRAYELKATPEDRTGFSSLFLGNGPESRVPPMPRLKYFAGMKMMNGMMRMDGSMDDMGMNMSLQRMDMNTVMYPEVTGAETMHHQDKMDMDSMPAATLPDDFVTLNYAMLRAPRKTTLPDGPTRILRMQLTGNMNRYVWTLNHRTVSEADKILIKKGENLRIILENASMMRHPMHLHGHFFRVLNGQGEYAPRKNVLDIMPMETDTIEFAATESGDWFFHCHILYHMMSGMGRIFSYENSPPNPELPRPRQALRRLFRDDRQFHPMAHIGLESNGSDGELMFANTRWKFGTLWHLGLHDYHGYESETSVGRYLGKMQWLFPYIGFDYHYKTLNHHEDRNILGSDKTNLFGQRSNKNDRKALMAGIAYTLPMFLIADLRMDGDGKFRLQLSREDLALSSRLRFNFMLNTDREYMAGFRYVLTKYCSLSAHYDSDMGLGGGVTVNY